MKCFPLWARVSPRSVDVYFKARSGTPIDTPPHHSPASSGRKTFSALSELAFLNGSDILRSRIYPLLPYIHHRLLSTEINIKLLVDLDIRKQAEPHVL